MTLFIQSEGYVIGIDKPQDDSERTVGNIIEPQKDGTLLVVATFNEAVAIVIEQLANQAHTAEQRVKELEAKQHLLVGLQVTPSSDVYDVARAALAYIDALPLDVVASLPAMPGFDRDWADAALRAVASVQVKQAVKFEGAI